jgi:hypothetical protein
MFVEFDMNEFERIYQKLCVQLWESDDEPDFPFDYKIEYLCLLALLFNDNGVYTRSENIIQQLKEIHEKHPENKLIAEKYIYVQLSRSYDIWTMFADNPDEYLKPIGELIQKSDFSPEIKKELAFKSQKLRCDYCSISKISDGIAYLDIMLNIVAEPVKREDGSLSRLQFADFRI